MWQFLSENNTHKIVPFNKIGLNDNEIKRIENIFKDVDNKLNKFNKMKKDIENLFIKIKSIKENKLIIWCEECWFKQFSYIFNLQFL